MKFLKRKIEKCKDILKPSIKPFLHDLSTPSLLTPEPLQSPLLLPNGVKIQKRNRVRGQPISKHAARAIKNMAKNYGRAICNFCLGEASEKYLKKICEKYGEELGTFREYIIREKESIEGIDTFRGMLLVGGGDDERLGRFKRIF
jgi:hypothetical protein